MSRTRTVVMESRPYDTVYDPVFSSSAMGGAIRSDPRVQTAMSSTDMIAGTARFKYFRRPMIPKLNAMTTQVLLAPTNEDPLAPIEEAPEPLTKTVEIQTMYRESEAQTVPYTPEYVVPEGTNPELLLLQELRYDDGLPLGVKDIEMVEQARLKRVLESSLPPFTDEASLLLRKHLMEKQEIKEFKFRENEIDAKREEKLSQLRQVLYERDESSDSLSAQRVESIRQLRMTEHEKAIDKIKSKRIKILRRLARERSKVNPVLHEVSKRDIIDDHYDKASQLYAPVRYLGQEFKIDREKFSVMSRTMAFVNMATIEDLESTIPRKLLNVDDVPKMNVFNEFSKSSLAALFPKHVGDRLLENRLTSSSRRDLKNNKRDIEMMHTLLQTKKKAFLSEKPSTTAPATANTGHTSHSSTAAMSTSPSAVTSPRAGNTGFDFRRRTGRGKGRPVTPDLTTDEQGDIKVHDRELHTAVILLQRILRGRVVQNAMIEGKYRRRELVKELRSADEYFMVNEDKTLERNDFNRDSYVKLTTEEAIIGGLASNIFARLADEKHRMEYFDSLQEMALLAVEERRKLEAAEAGRRQRENMAYPKEFHEHHSA